MPAPTVRFSAVVTRNGAKSLPRPGTGLATQGVAMSRSSRLRARRLLTSAGCGIVLLGTLPAQGWQPPPPDLDRAVVVAAPAAAPCRDGTLDLAALQQCLAAADARHRCLHARLSVCG
jgi:hypothetical protein